MSAIISALIEMLEKNDLRLVLIQNYLLAHLVFPSPAQRSFKTEKNIIAIKSKAPVL